MRARVASALWRRPSGRRRSATRCLWRFSLLILAASVPAVGQPVGLTRAAASLEVEAALPRQARHGLSTEVRLRPELEFALPRDMRLTAIGRARADWFDHLEPGVPTQDAIDPIARPQQIGNRAELELRELYLEAAVGALYLRLGKQQIVWGAADGLKVLDVVNPQRFREFILADFEDSRIPLWAVNVETRVGALDWQFILIPEQTFHHIPGPESPYAITAPRFAPPPPSDSPITSGKPKRPSRPLADADAGVRIATFVAGWDLSAFYLYHFEDIPVLNLETSATGVALRPHYDRVHLIGGTFAKAFGPLTLRGELGYTLDRDLFLRAGRTTRRPGESDILGSVVGLDWSGRANWLISGQLFVDHVLDPPGKLHRPRTDTTTTLLIRRQLHHDTLALELRWLANLNDGDGILRPKVSYQVDDRTTVWTGLDYFYGDHQGIFGQFDTNDRTVFGIRFDF